MKTNLFNVSVVSLPFSSTSDFTFYKQFGGYFWKSRGRLPCRCTWFMLPVFNGVAHLPLLLFMYYFSYFMFFVVYICFPCLVFVPGYILFISARILVPLITLNQHHLVSLQAETNYLVLTFFESLFFQLLNFASVYIVFN